MKARAVIRELMEKQNITNAIMAHRLNMTLAATWELVSKEKNNYDMRAAKVYECLDALGYKLIAVPKDLTTPTEGYEIDNG